MTDAIATRTEEILEVDDEALIGNLISANGEPLKLGKVQGEFNL